MTNERNQGIPGHAGRHAGAPAQGNNPRARAAAPQPGHAQKASMTSQLSQALPMLEVDEMAAPMGAPVEPHNNKGPKMIIFITSEGPRFLRLCGRFTYSPPAAGALRSKPPAQVA